jgi:APA family basic amino acid/polyamine antiporter
MEKDRIARLEKKSLKRVLGTSDLFAIGYGDVGSSLYYSLGVTALFALGATPIAMALAGLVFVCTALTYAELASTFPEPGGSATFTRYAFNDLISFIAGWGLLLDYIVTLAISVFTIPPYLRHLIRMSGIEPPVSIEAHETFSIAIIVFLYIINLIGVKYSGRFSFILAFLTALTQLMIFAFGIVFLTNLPHVFEMMKIGVKNVALSPSWGDFLKGTAMAMVAYTGVEAIAQLAGETKKPAIAVPRAIKYSVVLLIFLYIGVSLVAMAYVSPELLGTRYVDDAVAGVVANFPHGGKILAPWVGLIAALLLLIGANAGLLGCSRLTFSMGEYYQVPNALYKTHPRFRTPYVSLGVFALLGALIVFVSQGKMLFMADLYNIGAQIAYFSANMALIVLRYKKPELERPFRAPLNIPIGKKRSIPVTAILGGFCNLSVFIIVVVTKPEGRYAAMVWMALGLLMYFIYRRKKHISATGQLQVQKIKIPEYAPMHVKNILVAARMFGDTESLQMACQLAHLHRAKLTAVNVIEIPLSLPMNIHMDKREEIGEEVLRRAQAIAGEYHVHLEMELIRARSMHKAIEDLIDSGRFDLVILGVGAEEYAHKDSYATEAGKIFHDAPCRVLFCRSKPLRK